MAPFHPPEGQDPISTVQGDLEMVQLLDRLGYEEAWIGEHHSAGTEIIPERVAWVNDRLSARSTPRFGVVFSYPRNSGKGVGAPGDDEGHTRCTT
jgi:alkanesulfonate monooxygenase SsuD/methylene tetrahydromethanopterin reductase-like flavin-dependent oxidoreductase (luciferase family)